MHLSPRDAEYRNEHELTPIYSRGGNGMFVTQGEPEKYTWNGGGLLSWDMGIALNIGLKAEVDLSCPPLNVSVSWTSLGLGQVSGPRRKLFSRSDPGQKPANSMFSSPSRRRKGIGQGNSTTGQGCCSGHRRA